MPFTSNNRSDKRAASPDNYSTNPRTIIFISKLDRSLILPSLSCQPWEFFHLKISRRGLVTWTHLRHGLDLRPDHSEKFRAG